MTDREVTRTRQGGRRVTNTTDPEELLQAFRDCVKSQSFAKINGVTVDTYSASAVVLVAEQLKAENREKLLRMPVHKMVSVVFRLISP